MIPPADIETFEEHADEAAFLWALRDAAARDPHYDLEELCGLDERLDAHLDGLRLAGGAGWEVAREALDTSDPGAAFVAAVLSVEGRDLPGVARVLDRSEGSVVIQRAVAAGLGWVSMDALRRVLPGLLHNLVPPEVQRLGIAGAAAHRLDPGQILGFAVCSDHPRLRARALRAAGELGRTDLLPAVRSALDDGDEECCFAAAWAGALLDEPQSSVVLRRLAEGGGPFAERAARMVARWTAPASAATEVRALARVAESPRSALAAAAALGDPTLVPWLFERMAEPSCAREAAAALVQISGVDLAAEKLIGKAPADFQAGPSDDAGDEDVAPDPAAGLPWPDVPGLRRWWTAASGRFRSGTRHLLGKPLAPEWLEQVLRRGSQSARAAAAVELCFQKKRRVLFEVRARGQRQRRALASG